jgi:SAM-dependent methyltransferase
MSADGVIGSGALRQLIRRYYGDECRIIDVRKSGARAFVFVCETTLRGRPLRLLGTVGRTRELMEHSAMDLGMPERLVFPYERMMFVAAALVAQPRAILLLGLGGGAMLRHLAAYLPEAEVTAVERDAGVIAFAREHFHIKHKIVRADAEEVVADARGKYDLVMVDLYDAGGGASLGEAFWRDCAAALRPGGCIAVNWAGGWTGAGLDGTPAQRLAQAIPALAGTILLTERVVRGNIVQLAPSAPGFRITSLGPHIRAFGERRKLPREDRTILLRCDVSRRYPTVGPSGKLEVGGKRGKRMA